MVLKGLSKRLMRETAHVLKTRFLLDERLIRMLVDWLDKLQDGDLAVEVLVWWDFLLRVLSEGLCLWKGCAEWALQLPPGRSHALWIQGDALCLRMEARKNRPKGSLLTRRCSCIRMKGSRYCAFHRFKGFASSTPCDSLLWNFQAQKTLSKLKGALTLLGESQAQMMGWKAWRAGRATSMAAAGDSLGKILDHGEWRSKAVLAYIDESQVDATRLLMDSLEASDREDDDPCEQGQSVDLVQDNIAEKWRLEGVL